MRGFSDAERAYSWRQVCLPGCIPITLDSVLPRRMGGGAWNYHAMAGYTSVGVGSSIVTVRFNCLPEITLHHLRRTESPKVYSSKQPGVFPGHDKWTDTPILKVP